MSETTEFKDVYEAIASVSPNRQNILYTVLEEDAFGEKAFFSDDKLVWESTKGGFFSQNQEEVGKLHDSGQATAAGKKLFCDCLGGEKRLVICGQVYPRHQERARRHWPSGALRGRLAP